MIYVSTIRQFDDFFILCVFIQVPGIPRPESTIGKQKTKVDFCIEELLTTEKNYVDVLKMLVEKFINQLKATVLKPDQLSIIFMNIEVRFSLSSTCQFGFYLF